ncbi:phosphoenolpyruvate carboxylase, partial [Acinetobacter baumannii]
VLQHYLDAVHALGAELSISSEHATIDAEVAALAEASGDSSASRTDEPYRRALTGIYARLAATHLALTGKPAPRASALAGKPY